MGERGKWKFYLRGPDWKGAEGTDYFALVGEATTEKEKVQRMAYWLYRKASISSPQTSFELPPLAGAYYGRDRLQKVMKEVGDAARAMIAFENGELTEYEFNQLDKRGQEFLELRRKSVERQKEIARQKEEGGDLWGGGGEEVTTAVEEPASEGYTTAQKAAAGAAGAAIIYAML